MNRIQVEPFGRGFDCADDETVLEGALRHGVLLRYGCKHGGCGTCTVRLVDGDVEEHGSSFALSPGDRAADLILACASIPLEPCVIDVEPSGLTEEEYLSGDRSRPHDTRVGAVRPLTGDIAAVSLDVVGDPIAFTAGQFVNVEIPGTELVRTFSLANAPSDGRRIDLIVKLYPDGAFSRFLREGAVAGLPVRVLGPYGRLRIHLSHRDVLMIAGGSGLAPLLSMLRDLADRDFDRPVTLFFGARTAGDLYLTDEIRRVGSRLRAFEFRPVLSESWPADWAGETGLVTDALSRWRPRLAHDVYLCGPPPMIDAAVPLLTAAGVRPRNVYFDAFTPATPMTRTAALDPIIDVMTSRAE
ncbi:2Fe-2S iron-sulfur cluster-binding protein [Pseudonocardia sp.]|uniref:2Fe-2S iron-sulfur cluster-binding protein n=1 Tax=Pseudonocardia sp. TaxID=60912 RepID=UPI003D120F8A